MKAKQKAKELIDDFNIADDGHYCGADVECALISVKQIRDSWTIPIIFSNEFTDKQRHDFEIHRNKLNKYWDEVELEIKQCQQK